jgi:hypothetical protein
VDTLLQELQEPSGQIHRDGEVDRDEGDHGLDQNEAPSRGVEGRVPGCEPATDGVGDGL